MKKIVITGGPCGGKTSAIRALEQEFNGRLLVVPEAATLLLSGGFPVPGRDVDWSQNWQDAFQAAVTKLQHSLEQAYQLIADQRGITLLICDRGLLDGAAYTPGGRPAFARRYGVKIRKTMQEYESVIHLESLATAQPELYGQGNNEHRFEPLAEAQALEGRTRAAWSGHRCHLIIENKSGLKTIISAVIETVRARLSD
ncbi:MAG: ATP-binding protein [Patescibacteria group bacterium]